MKAALVDLTYQGLTVSFNEDGWFMEYVFLNRGAS